MKHTLCRWGTALTGAICAPHVEHEIHYECDLYKKKEDERPLSSLRIDHRGGMPLIKLLTILGAMVAVICAARAVICALRSLCCCHRAH